MALPNAVQRQVEIADRMVSEMTGQQTAPEAETVGQTQEPAQQPPISQETIPEPTPAPAATEDKWEHKYLTLKGMYDAEVPRMHQTMREMQTQVNGLVAENATFKAQKLSTTEAAPAKTLITDSDKEAFGTDLLDLIDRATEQKVAEFRSREAQLRVEIDSLKGNLGTVHQKQTESEQDRFVNGLAAKVTDWEALNLDQGFLSWLQQVDPVYGVPRQAALNGAVQRKESDRVATIFNAYKATLGDTPPPAANNRQELLRQVAPTRSRQTSAPATTTGEGRVWNESEIARFYAQSRSGYMDEAEVAKVQAEIDSAVSTGRVRVGA